MARYRVLRRCFINGALEEPGAEVEYDGVPGSALEPLDDAATAAKEAVPAPPVGMRTVDGRRPPRLVAPVVSHLPRELVEIPDNWRDMTPQSRIALSRQLGAPARGTTAVVADKMIEGELVNRKTV